MPSNLISEKGFDSVFPIVENNIRFLNHFDCYISYCCKKDEDIKRVFLFCKV